MITVCFINQAFEIIRSAISATNRIQIGDLHCHRDDRPSLNKEKKYLMGPNMQTYVEITKPIKS